MKKILYLLLCVSLAGMNHSCTDDFDNTNKNPNKIYDARPEYIFPGVVYKSMNAQSRMNYRLLTVFSHYINNWVEQKDTEDMSGYFEDLYVRSLKDLRMLEEEYVGKEGFENVGNILMTWKAYMYYYMVSSWGGIPMSEATPPKVPIQPGYKYDNEEDIYATILEILDRAVETFDTNGDQLVNDPLFRDSNGRSDIAKWRKFANSLRLNIALTIQNMDRALAETHIRKALTGGNENYLIASVDDIAGFRYGTDINTDASFYYRDFLNQMDAGTNTNWTVYPAMGHNFFLYMKSYNDPRLSKFVEPAEGDQMAIINNDTLTCVNPIDPNLRDSVIVRYGLPFVPRRGGKIEPAGWIVGTDPTSPTGERYRSPYSDIVIGRNECFVNRDYIKADAEVVLLNWTEVCFMKAEVAIKFPGIVSGSAQQYYEEGIRTSMKQYGVSDPEITAYMELPGVKWDTNGDGCWEYCHFYKADIKGKGGDANHLEQIYKQWYITDFFNGHAGWTLERRTRAVNFPPHFYNGSVSTEGSNGICDYMQERLLYPVDEQIYNTAAYHQATLNLQTKSTAPNPARGGDNFFTLLQIATQQPDGGDLSKWMSGEIIYDGEFIRNWYSKTMEEVLEATGGTSEDDLTNLVRYELMSVRSTYDPETGTLYVYDPETGTYVPKDQESI
ncbi:MAG: SusD/RagB family nutrient-binding outer membrane lipoprotein [Bacteroides sp.]|nr:SusD/RagB family nutrient-binding outer membrane lipoprotein [Bacteroides sp.]